MKLAVLCMIVFTQLLAPCGAAAASDAFRFQRAYNTIYNTVREDFDSGMFGHELYYITIPQP